MKRHARRMLTAATLVGLTVALTAQAAFKLAGDTDVRFQAVGPAGLSIDGEGTTLSVSETDGKLKVAAPLKGLKTGIELRDNHLKKTLNVEKHPEATLVVDRSALKLPDDNASVESTATGQFTLNGQTQSVPFTYRAKRTGSDYHVQGRTEINIEKFKIEQPCYLGVCVDPNVKIKVKFKLRDN